MLQWLFGKKKQQPPVHEQQKKQKKKQKKKQQQDNWMYQFLVQFLSSPIWRVSILDFVDNKCIVFDNQQENKFQYSTIHNEFKQLVGNLVDGMMEQIGLSQQKLAQLIEKGFRSKQVKLFNQLLLADDFLRFKELMLKRNKALQQQAIKALEQSQSKNTNSQRRTSKIQQQREILKQSKRIQQQRLKKIQQQEQQILRKVLQLSKMDIKQNQALKQLQSKVFDTEKQTENKKQTKQSPKKEQTKQLNKAPNKLQPLKRTSKVTSNLGQLPPLNLPKSNLSMPVKKQQNNSLNNKKQQQFEQKIQKPKIEQKKQIQVIQKQQKQSAQQRKQRLLAQRQKIRRQKQQQRKKHLQNQEPQKVGNMHNAVLQQDGIYQTNLGVKEEQKIPQNKISQEQIKRRKQLMNKIKNRIVDDF